MAAERVRLESIGPVAHLVLTGEARGNALDPSVLDELRGCVDRLTSALAEPDAPRVVVLRAEGQHFCVGGELRAFGGLGDSTTAFVQAGADTLHASIRGLVDLPVPMVVAVHGAVAGAGLALALTGDLLVAARSARFRVAYTAVGLTPDGGTSWLLPRAVGVRRALELTLTNRTLDADDARAWGIASTVVEDSELGAAVDAVAQSLAGGVGHALRGAKALLRTGSEEPDLAAQLQREGRLIAEAAGTPETQAAIQAFLTRRN
jgi:2-(1,2-epoxy-1,2-dihydrophenyl)acetyl-CoA isomerase